MYNLLNVLVKKHFVFRNKYNIKFKLLVFYVLFKNEVYHFVLKN